MAAYTQRITLDVGGNYLPFYKYMKQGDGDSAYLVVTVTANGQQLIPAAGDTAYIRVVKPDHTEVVNDASINADGSITARITTAMTAAAGIAKADICIVGASEDVLSTATFFLDIDASPSSGAASTNEFLDLIRIVKEGKELLGDYETALAQLEAIGENAEAWAVGQRGGADVSAEDKTYHNNAKYYSGLAAGSAQTAGQQATSAGNSASAAASSSLAAEGYALGTQNGNDVAPGSPYYHNNAAYFASIVAAAIANAGYDVDFDTETQMLYLLDAEGNRVGDGVYLEIGSDGLAFNGGYQDADGRIHLTMDGEDLPPETFTPFQVAGGGGGTVSSIIISSVVKPASVRNGADAVFSFVASSSDDTNITVNWYVDGILRATISDRASGSSFSFNAKTWLKPSDTSAVKAVLSSESGATLNRQWSVTSTAFSLAFGSAIQPVMLYAENSNIYVVVEVSAQAGTTNNVTLSVGSSEIEKSIVGSREVTFEVNKSMLNVGANVVTVTMVSSTDETDAADPIHFTAVWAYGATAPIVAFANAEQSASQYDIAPIRFLVYDPGNETATCSLQVGTEPARSLTVNRTMQTLNFVPQEYGTKAVTLTCGNSSASMTLTIAKSDYNIGMVTGDNLRYNLDPAGHSNADADRADFGGMTLSAGFDWVNGGFHADANGAPAFVVKKGHRATLPRPLFGDADGNGKTVDISFRIANSDLYGAVAMQELDNGEAKGLILRANEGELRLNNTTGQLFRYCEDSRIDMSINVEAVNDHRVMTVWLDGIPAKVNTYANGTLVQSENALVIGSDHCDVWVYAIRVYNSSLSTQEMIQNYTSLGSTTAEKITRCQENDVYDGNGVITMETLHAAAPDLTIVHISAERMTTGKKDPVDAVITIRDGANMLTLDTMTKFMVQGTSSAAYGRSAYNLDIDFKNSGKTYAISSGAIPVNYINIKVNVASSENANNICAADMYNTFQPYLVPARATAGVRDTVEGKPCAVFFTNTSSNTIWIGSQQLRPGDTVLYAMGDICNSKKNTDVFGQGGTGEHDTKGCIEVSGNDTPAQQFRASSTYVPEADDGKGEWQTTVGEKTSLDFEWRTKPKSSATADEVAAAWNAAVAWVVSTIGDSAKFKAEVGNYFAIDSLLYHFLWMEFYSAFDNVSKNTFYSYDWDESAGKFLWNICKNYDDDTILGCDNDGVPLADYGADFGDTAGSRSLFNADNNTIWVNIQEAYYSELAAMYITLRGRGAWDAASIIRKWDSYQHVRPHAAMAEDAFNKYILPYKTTGVTVGTEVKSYDDSYLARLQGSKTYQRRQFLTYQAKYMDGKYGYYSTSGSIAFRANAPAGTTQDLEVAVYAKTYVTIIVDNGTRVSKKIATGGSAVFQNTAVHSNATIYVTPESLINSITPIDEINNSTFSAAGASKLQDVTLGSAESENTAWDANTGLSIPSVLLKTLSIRNITNFASALDLSANVDLESVDTRGTNAGIITLPSYAPLRTIYLNDCSGITALNLLSVTAFSMANGSKLTMVHVENCNSVINEAVYGYLDQAVAAGGSATRRIRMTGINWTLEDLNVLEKIGNTWRGYNATGEESDSPVITGQVYVNRWTRPQLASVEARFPNLAITTNPDGESPVYTVSFRSHDGTLLATQSVNLNGAPTDPTTGQDPITTPTRESTPEYDYVFTGWAASAADSAAIISDLSTLRITRDTDLFAHFGGSLRYYTVRWYNGTVLLKVLSDVEYGTEVIYDGAIPVHRLDGAFDEDAGDNAYYLFTGWDKSTGCIQADTDVYALYSSATAPSSAPAGGFTPEQIKALIGKGILSPTGETNTLIASGDTVDILAGCDVSFSNVPSHELINLSNPRQFDGTNIYKPQINGRDILLFDDAKSWTLVIDFNFNTACSVGGCLVSSYQTSGFRLRYASGGSIAYNTGSMAASSNGVREIVILRRKKGDNRLHVYSSRKNSDAIAYAALDAVPTPRHNAPLAFGANVDENGSTADYGAGTIHWAKFWEGDLGDAVCRELAAWPRQTFTMQAVGSSERAFRNFIRTDRQSYVNCAFLLKDLLEETHVMHPGNTNVGGWKAMPFRTWANARIFKALPLKWRQLVLTVYVNSSAGNRSNDIVDPPAEDKIWIPSVKEIGSQTTTVPYSQESDVAFNIFTSDASRIKRLNFGAGAASAWWTRSPYTGYSNYFWGVNPSGSTGNGNATNSYGVAFGFCI